MSREELDHITEAVGGTAVKDPWPLGGGAAEATAATGGVASLSASPRL